MAELPYLKLYVGDYLVDTMHLSLEEHGAYLKLLMEYWTNGAALRDDNRRFSRLLGISLKKWRAIRPTLAEFFVCDGITWAHKRMEVDLAQARHNVSISRKAGRASGRSRNLAKSSKKTIEARQRTFNGRSTDVATDVANPFERNANPSTSKENPLTPLDREPAAPAQKAGRAASAGEAKAIGEVLAKGSKFGIDGNG